jgi:hypothetical protein
MWDGDVQKPKEVWIYAIDPSLRSHASSENCPESNSFADIQTH